MSKSNELTVLQKILDGHADVFGDLPSINDSDPNGTSTLADKAIG